MIDRIKDIGLDVQINQDKEQVVLGLLGDTRSVQDIAFRSYEGVDTTIRISNTYKLTSREFHPQDTVVEEGLLNLGLLLMLFKAWKKRD